MQNYLKPNVIRAASVVGIINTGLGCIGFSPIVFSSAINQPLAQVSLLALVGSVVGCLVAPISWLLYIGTGILAVLWGKGQSISYTFQQGAIEGAIAGGIAGIIAQGVMFVFGILIGIVFSATALSGVGGTGSNIIASVIGSCLGFVFWVIVAAVLGAVGGLLYVAIQGNKAKPA